MQPSNYFVYLQGIVGDETAIEREKTRLDKVIAETSGKVKAGITERTVPGLIWDLTMKEIERIRPLVGLPVSNFPAHARFLRAIAAAIPFEKTEIGDDPGTDALLESCEHLWHVLFFREMMDDLKRADVTAKEAKKRQIAALMSLLDAIQLEFAYLDQADDRIRTLFCPFSHDIIEPRLGLSAENVLTGIKFVREETARRYNRAQQLMEPLYREWQSFRELTESAALQYMREMPQKNSHRETIAHSFAEGTQLLNQFLVFTPGDLQTALGNRAEPFLAAFSFVPGKVNCGLTTPFDADVVRARPFAALPGNQFLLFDLYYLSFAPVYRLAECFTAAKDIQRLHRHRDKTLERAADTVFAPIADPSLRLFNYYLPVGKGGTLAERDLLFFHDGILLLVESKAKPLRPISEHRGNVRKIESDVKASIQAAYDQACLVARHIAGCDGDVIFFDSDKPGRKEIARLHRKDIREVHTIVFLDAYCGLIGTDLVPWLVIDNSVGFPWIVDRDTMEAIALKIDTFDKLTTFLSWRRQLHGRVFCEDEAVFAGYFVRHGPAAIPKDVDMVQLDPKYTDVFEAEYFQRKGIPVKTPPVGLSEPVFASMRRDGNKMIQEIGGKVIDTFDLFQEPKQGEARNGEHVQKRLKSRVPGDRPPTRPREVGRNSPCPCGSGLKFKRCCMRRRK